MKKFALVLLLFLLGAGGAFTVLYLKRQAPSNPVQQSCAKHSLDTCPFCDQSQVEKQGECKEHSVPEALCHLCRPDLVAAFKIEGDWCGGHKLPESQCKLCGGGGPVKKKDGAILCGKHEVPAGQCPFCDTSLVKKMGMCGGHKVPEALCSRCNKDLIPGFKAEGDWCQEHGLPESQCVACGGGKSE